MARYIENLFRYWLRFAVILIVLPVPASAATLAMPQPVASSCTTGFIDISPFNSQISVFSFFSLQAD